LEAARLPNLARVAAMGRVGCAVTTPPGFEAGSDVCSMALLGYDPARYHTGRAPLEAAAIGIDPGLSDWIFRLNLVTTGDGAGRFPGDKMLDHSAGAITDGEARQLVADLVSHWKKTVPEAAAGFTLTPGVSYRNILVDSSGTDYRALRTTPPHAVPGQPWREHLPEGPGSERLRALMESGAAFLPGHEINQAPDDAAVCVGVWAARRDDHRGRPARGDCRVHRVGPAGGQGHDVVSRHGLRGPGARDVRRARSVRRGLLPCRSAG
jgi:2,3-bisphosphoglycerate-independent phosphoglycerate mutase